MVLDKLTENAQKNENRNRNFEIEIPKQTMDSVATVAMSAAYVCHAVTPMIPYDIWTHVSCRLQLCPLKVVPIR